MLHFFYDSLDTLKKVKKPTWKEVRVFTVQVFVVVLVSAFIFFVLDNLRGNLYQQIFQSFWSTQPTVQVQWAQTIPVIPSVPQEPVVAPAEMPTEEIPTEEPVVAPVDAPAVEPAALPTEELPTN